MEYLGIEIPRPKVAFFDFTGCQGCQLQIANKEESLISLFSAVEVVNFREISSEKRNDYDIAFIDGAVSRQDEVERLVKIRRTARKVISIGTCACFGGVNAIRNKLAPTELILEVYGDIFFETLPVRSVKDVIDVDFELPGCPISKSEFENLVVHLLLGVDFRFKKYPVCVECKQNLNHCLLDEGEICLGPLTRAGCRARCLEGRWPCYGCRGPVEGYNWPALREIFSERGFSPDQILEKMSFFNSLKEVTGEG